MTLTHPDEPLFELRWNPKATKNEACLTHQVTRRQNEKIIKRAMVCLCPIFPHLNNKTRSHNKRDYAIVLDCAVAHNCCCQLANGESTQCFNALAREKARQEKSWQGHIAYVTRRVTRRRT